MRITELFYRQLQAELTNANATGCNGCKRAAVCPIIAFPVQTKAKACTVFTINPYCSELHPKIQIPESPSIWRRRIFDFISNHKN